MFTNYACYYDLARQLGARISPPAGPGLFDTAIHLDGQFGGRPIAIHRHIGKGSFVVFRAPLLPALDLGLSIRASGVISGLQEVFGAVDVEVGDAAFDAAFAVRADDPGRAAAFLEPLLRASIGTCAEAPLSIDDEGVSLRYTLGPLGASEDADLLHRALRSITSIGHAMDAARAGTPSSADVAPLVRGLEAFARERNLACALDVPARVVGALEGCPMWVAARRRKKGVHDLEMGVRFEHPLGFYFGVSTARTGAGTWLAGKDVQVGHAGFDRAFDVHGDPPEKLLELLDESCRASLLELGQGRALRLEATGLYLRDDARDFDPVALPVVLDRMVDLVKSLARKAHLQPTQAYR